MSWTPASSCDPRRKPARSFSFCSNAVTACPNLIAGRRIAPSERYQCDRIRDRFHCRVRRDYLIRTRSCLKPPAIQELACGISTGARGARYTTFPEVQQQQDAARQYGWIEAVRPRIDAFETACRSPKVRSGRALNEGPIIAFPGGLTRIRWRRLRFRTADPECDPPLGSDDRRRSAVGSGHCASIAGRCSSAKK
jgi:hypothetical protein